MVIVLSRLGRSQESDEESLVVQSVLLVFCSNGDKRLSINALPPLGVLGIASYLEAKGIQVDVIDFSISPDARVEAGRYDVIGFSINISNRQPSLQVIDSIRRSYPDQHLIAGGPLCMSNPEILTQSGHLDAIFTCEGEEALFEYLTSEDKASVKGIYLKNGSDYHFTGVRAWIKDLDTLPFPAFDKVDMNKYSSVPKQGRPVSSMMTSRGCPFSCIFCSHAMGRKWRPRSPENVVEEIKWQVYEFGVREICVYDDNFSLNQERAEAICDLLIKEQLPLTLQFSNGLRADSLDERLLAKLRKAGTWLIGLAPESGNPDVMKKIKKGFDHSQVIAVRKECKRLGIKNHGFYMVGFPFESRQDIEDTVRFAKMLDCEIVEFNKVIPYAQTELHDIIVDGGYLLEDSVTEVQSYHEGGITTHRVGDLSPDEVKHVIRKAYRDYYLRPRKMVDLLRTFSIRDLLELTTYAVRTGNV
jgi:radical SAM superfamily enzyme YgiQ (UPF0313 family)